MDLWGATPEIGPPPQLHGTRAAAIERRDACTAGYTIIGAPPVGAGTGKVQQISYHGVCTVTTTKSTVGSLPNFAEEAGYFLYSGSWFGILGPFTCLLNPPANEDCHASGTPTQF